MPRLGRDDGVELHWEEEGSGALVILVPYCTMHPSAYDPVAAELVEDHRVVRYDDRGTGRSSRTGPHDMATGSGDLAAVIEVAGAPAVVVCVGDAASRAVRVAAARPALVEGVIVPAGLPAGREVLEGSEAMARSDTVVQALISMLETDYRGALRSLVSAGNAQMSEEEIRERVRLQSDYVPQETGIARMREWVKDDASEPARACGERLWLLCADNATGGWFPAGRQAVELARRVFPEAHVRHVPDGMVSRPDLTAEAVRRVTARQPADRP